MERELSAHSVNPLRFCEQLYSVVVGLGLAFAADQVVDLSRSGIPVLWERLPLFVAYLSVAFPYAHGAVRYIDVVYVEHRLGPIPPARAIADVLLDGVRMWWLIALSFLVSRPIVFGYVLALLLLSGTSRRVVARVTATTSTGLERSLDRVNGIMLLATVVIIAVGQLGFDGSTEASIARIGLLVASLAFPFVVYATSFPYFFRGD